MSAPEPFRQRGFRFALSVLQLYRLIRKTTDVPQHITNQMLEAGTSICANLEEAKSASSRRDLIAKNAISLREARECRFWLRLIQADQPQLAGDLKPMIAECQELVAILTSAVRRLRGNGPAGDGQS
jgi:four helix bundle protein